MAIHENENKTITLAEALVLAVSAIVTVFTLVWVLRYCHYGFDFTDESFYLVWMANPFNYSVSATQFGFIYHPLYQLLDGNIANLRQANILITFCLAWVLGNVFLKTTFETQALETKYRLTISAALATTSLILFDSWLPTPSYNSLALQSFLLAATGLLFAENKSSRASIMGWFLIGVGGWLAFMAKPTSAAALALCSGVYLLLAGKLRIRLLAISLATALFLLVVSALAIDGSISGFIDRLKDGAEMYKTLGAGHANSPLLRLDSFNLSRKAKILLVVGTIIIASAAYLSQAKNRLLIHVGTIFSVSFALIGLAIMCGFIQKPLNVGHSQGLLILAVPFAAILAGVATNKFKGLLQITLAQGGLIFAFLAFPHAYAFGTGNNYWNHGTSAAIFWVFAGLILFNPITSGRQLSNLLLPIGLVAQLVTVALIQGGIEAPYRQPQALQDNDYTLEIGNPGATLMLSKGFGHYIAEVVGVAEKAGFKKGTPMIDLTGQSPGILYALGANSIGQAWLLGGYPGSDVFAVTALKKVTCHDLASAWLLTEPTGSRKISPEIPSSFGANTITDFEIVGAFKTAEGAGGYKVSWVQQLLKPIRPVDTAMAACIASRATN